MEWMNLKPGWLLLAALSFLAACALWTGILFCVSWLTGRARMMADGPEVGGLALTLYRRWAVPQLVLSLVSGVVWLGGSPGEQLRAHWVYGVLGAWIILAFLHMAVGSRAARVVRGSKRASAGDGMRRIALVVSCGAIIAFCALRTQLIP